MIQNKNKLRIAFRVDSSKTLGLGHLKRCLSIAEYFSKKGMECIFLISNNNKEEIEKYGHIVFKVNQTHTEGIMIKKILEKEKCKALIIDSKRKSILKIIKSVKDSVKVVLIDNRQFANHADLAILPGIREQFGVCPENCLVGPKYVIINPEFKQQKTRKKKNVILLSMGGSDKKNITFRIVSEFKKVTSDFKLLVILGKFYVGENKLRKLISNDDRFKIIKDPQNFPHLMFECSVGIIAFGITVYESVFARLPTFVISHSNENDISAKRMANCDWFKYLGKYNKIKYKDAVNEIISYFHNDQLLKMSSYNSIIDDKGAERIANVILQIIHS
ncbi:MAG: hypothetical protein KGI09_01215 [Thaumarchaeota archaeon]|nr:hypothetical protein [Nitrososphaerota archaeon]